MSRTFRLVSFNILEGFRPFAASAVERRLLDRDRVDAARSVVKELAPDVLVLNEALFCRRYAGRTFNYGALFDFPFQSTGLYDNEWGNAILSHHPIITSREMRIYDRGGIVATIETSDGALNVASYHPHPGRYPENKALDFTQLLDGLTGAVIVCGDLNCISPEDDIDRALLIEAFDGFSTNAGAAVDRFIESGKQVFSALRRLGFEDAVPHSGRRYSIPTDLINREKSSAMRVDHVLCNEAVQVIAGEVVHSAASNRASDHHPVMVEFRIG